MSAKHKSYDYRTATFIPDGSVLAMQRRFSDFSRGRFSDQVSAIALPGHRISETVVA
jgi:hypothetical protein